MVGGGKCVVEMAATQNEWAERILETCCGAQG
jgi:hypothetical protein